MSLVTTCIGAFPKPHFVKLPDWFQGPDGPDTVNSTERWAKALTVLGPDADTIITRGIAQVISDQITAGISIPTDGEVARENYIHYHCRHIEGIDFEHLSRTALRNGAYEANLPTVVSKVQVRDQFLVADWRRAQNLTDRPVKITLPGPMTISDTTVDTYYDDPVRLGADLAAALNVEVKALNEAGCRHIQIDEPLFARKPDAALSFGFENLERAFHGCDKSVIRTVHICCGYPNRLDNPDYPKADLGSYEKLVNAIEYSSIAAVSIEDAHRHNDLRLLESFKTTTVILGVVAVAKSVVEEVEEIHQRLTSALEHIDAHRLVAAPDCGLGLLSRETACRKLHNLCQAAGSIG
ncbi:MAG TPA: 5-methyltetrahydropteroyltriglutamate--homocysteine methyltransferase [Gammaproteobacteria bacterium]|jgi:5-methyltetrahydropteroyltriglutamate--homocysteine methyltransferase|nr:5-methyltetrahydropteroyltriglutamate--homocysteine methyltransferase [Gammaproteobacteria bacterium]